MTGLLGQITLELLIVELGSTVDLHLLPFQHLQGLASNSLIKSTWGFLHTHGIRLCHNITQPAPREKDLEIMTVFYQQDLPIDILEQLNKCRLYLKAFFLSDLTEGLGSSLLDEAWRGKPINLHRMESWPQQGKPSAGMWDAWRLHLQKHFLQRGHRLKNNLGTWMEWDYSWPWYFSPEDNSLYKFDKGNWTSFDIIQDRGVRPIFSTQGLAAVQPSLLRRATVIQTDKIIMCTGHGIIKNKRSESWRSFKDYLKSQKDDQWCFSYVKLQDAGFIINQAIRNQEAIAISDG